MFEITGQWLGACHCEPEGRSNLSLDCFVVKSTPRNDTVRYFSSFTNRL